MHIPFSNKWSDQGTVYIPKDTVQWTKSHDYHITIMATLLLNKFDVEHKLRWQNNMNIHRTWQIMTQKQSPTRDIILHRQSSNVAWNEA